MTLQSRITPSVRASDYGRNHSHAQAPKFAYGKNSMDENTMIAAIEAPAVENKYTPHKAAQPVYEAVMDIMKDGRERTVRDILMAVAERGLHIEQKALDVMVKCITEDGDLVREKLQEGFVCYHTRNDLLSDL